MTDDRREERRAVIARRFLVEGNRVDEKTVRERLAEIPKEDQRTFTARFFGDPNPADKRRQSA